MKVTAGDGEERPRKRPGRVPVSCAECRRLKLRCDRKQQWPCENCSKRGCASICPNGQLAGGKGARNRLVLANTEELHEKIDTLCARIRDLEDALRTIQSSVSSEPHPLLAEELLQVKAPVQSQSDRERDIRSSSGTPPFDDDELAVVDALGTLSIGENGETSYLGSTAGADYLLNDLETRSPSHRDKTRLPPELDLYNWPDIPSSSASSNPRIVNVLLDSLPSEQDAYDMGQIYAANGAWLGTCLPMDEVHGIIELIYGSLPSRTLACAHRLPLLYAIFALASLFNLSLPQYNDLAEDYYALSRVAFLLRNPMSETTVWTVETLIHIAMYLQFTDLKESHDKAYVFSGVALKLALSMGLHHDSSRFKLDEIVCKRRHHALWALYLGEGIHSHTTGRPPMLNDAYIGCPPPPLATNETKDFNGWIINFFRVARVIMQEAFGAHPPTYATVLKLDVKMRSYITPEWLVLDLDNAPVESAHMAEVFGVVPPTVLMQKWMALFFKDTFLLHLHRSFLVQALTDSPNDITKSKYGKSVAICYRSAHRLISGLEVVHATLPSLISRFGCFFDQVVSAAIVMALLVIRTRSSFVTEAMEKLDKVREVMEKVAPVNRAVRRNIEAVRDLNRRARDCFDRSLSAAFGIQPPEGLPASHGHDDKLSALWGKTRIVVRTRRSTVAASSTSSLAGPGYSQTPLPQSYPPYGSSSQQQQQRRAPGASLRDILLEPDRLIGYGRASGSGSSSSGSGVASGSGTTWMEGVSSGTGGGSSFATGASTLSSSSAYGGSRYGSSIGTHMSGSSAPFSFSDAHWDIGVGVTGGMTGGTGLGYGHGKSSDEVGLYGVGGGGAQTGVATPDYPGLDVTWNSFMQQLGF